jgi:hypothetical protein
MEDYGRPMNLKNLKTLLSADEKKKWNVSLIGQ